MCDSCINCTYLYSAQSNIVGSYFWVCGYSEVVGPLHFDIGVDTSASRQERESRRKVEGTVAFGK